MSVASYVKAPGAILDYSLTWGSWLLTGETIGTSTWAITSETTANLSDLSVLSSQISGGITTAWLQAGVVGTTYTASNTVTTSAGRTDERSITVTIQAR